MKKSFTLLCVGLALAGSLAAGTITENPLAPSQATATDIALGQSVTTPSGGPWTDLTFNLLRSTNTPYAIGDLYLLTQAYSGSPSGLSSSVAGFVASTSTISGGLWVFDPSVSVDGSTQYFLYMDTTFGDNVAMKYSGNTYSGGDAYATSSGNYGVRSFDLTFNFSGTEASAAPEPGTALLMSAIALTAFGVRRIRK